MTTATKPERVTFDPLDDPLDVLARLVEIAGELGHDIPDHRCSPTEHEDEFWKTYHAARRFVAANRD